MDSVTRYDKMINEIETRKDFVLANYRKLRQYDKHDHYWSDLLALAKHNYFFETSMVINWIGTTYAPRRILEIGIRTGGSLISLLSSYDSLDNVEGVSFDLWVEFGSTTFLPCRVNKRFPPDLNKYMAIRKVKKNLSRLNIPMGMIPFISGDSKQTVPHYFQSNPGKPFDYARVDGAHDRKTSITDLGNVAPHISSGGIIVFDDIGPESFKLIDVWEQFKESHSGEYDFFEKFNRKEIAWAFKK